MLASYYESLQLKKDCSTDEIIESYKKLSLRCHPRSSKESQDVANQEFSILCEAYEVLSDPIKRGFYDKYGYEKLRNGLFSSGQLIGGYKYANNPDQIFQNFHSSTEVTCSLVDTRINKDNSLFSSAFGGQEYALEYQCEDLIVSVGCTLNQLYSGAAKKVEFHKKKLNLDGKTTSMVSQQKLIQIKPGYTKNTVLEFAGEGHETVHRTFSNLFFKITELPDPNYSRKDDNLIYVKDISLADALSCQNVIVPMLDGRSLQVAIDEIVTPNQLKQVQNQGFYNETTKNRGNLYIRFNITFPTQIDEGIRQQLRKLLQ